MSNYSDKPNKYLIGPKDYHVTPNEISPVFEVSASKLASTFKALMDALPRCRFVKALDNKSYYVCVSKVFRFPDDLWVEFIELSATQSTLAIFSQARYGYYDFNVNMKRLQTLMTKLKQALNNG